LVGELNLLFDSVGRGQGSILLHPRVCRRSAGL
jgi:hypothetical protein